MTDAITFTIDAEDEESDQVRLPATLLSMLAEGEESPAAVVGDLALFSCAQRIHAAVHHGDGETDEELEAVEAETMELFEERFGASFGELTGHAH